MCCGGRQAVVAGQDAAARRRGDGAEGVAPAEHRGPALRQGGQLPHLPRQPRRQEEEEQGR